MKSRLLKISSVITVMLVILAAIPSTSFAAEELVVNSNAAVDEGEEFAFALNLSGCEVPIIGLQMYIVYDQTKLEYIEDSLEFEKIDGVIYNPNLENTIALNWTNVTNAADFSNKAHLLKLRFKAIGTGETEISYYISHMYGDDMGYIKNYTITYDITAGDDSIVTEQPAIVTSDEEFLSEHQGSFLNYDDSMGENSPNSDSHQLIKSTVVVNSIVDATRYVSVDSTDTKSGTGTTVLIIVGAVIIILAVVAVIIVKKRDDAKKRIQ